MVCIGSMVAGIALPQRRGSRRHGSRAAWLLGALFACTHPHFEERDAGETEAVAAGDAGESADAEQGSERDAQRCERDDCADDAARDADMGAGPDASGKDDVGAALDARVDTDAGAIEPAVRDTGAAPPAADAGLDPARAKWVGRYAVRSFVFSYHSQVRASASYLTLAEITPNADGGLTLMEELCRFESGFTLIASAHLLVDFPPGVRTTAPLSYDAEHFSSPLASAYVGYGAAPAGCAPGQTASVGSSRPWLDNGTCDCPSASAPPTSARDCRVIDSDGDSQPGNTFRLTLDTSVGVFRVAQEQQLRLVNGYRAGERLYAQRQFADVTKVLSCTVDGRPTRIEDCPLGTVGPCPPMFHQAELVPIGAQQGCAEIRERETGWFQKPRPEYPAGCPALVSPSP